MKKAFLFALLLLSSPVFAANAALSEKTMVPVGERIAIYLQAVMAPAGEVVDARNPGDAFSPHDPFRLSFNYDPENQVIDVYLAGNKQKPEDVKPLFELTQGLILKMNRKIKKYYGVTLKPEDISMDYLNVKAGQVVLKYSNGNYVEKAAAIPGAIPVPSATTQP